MKQWQKLSFSVPITQKVKGQQAGDYKIHGVAINATTTRNGTRFLAEELQMSAASLQNRPILKDHNNSVDSVVGRTTSASFDSTQQAVVFEGIILDPVMQQKIDQGLIDAVSIGAMLDKVEPVKNEESGEIEAFVARGIEFIELSLVAVPADPNAGFAKACMESYQLKQSEQHSVTSSPSPLSANGFYVVGQATSNGYVTSTTSYSTSKVEAEEKNMAEETVMQKLLAEKAQLEEKNAALQIELLKKDNEALEAKKKAFETITPTVATKTQGEVSTESATTETKHDGFVIESSGRYMSLGVTDYNNVQELLRLKR